MAGTAFAETATASLADRPAIRVLNI